MRTFLILILLASHALGGVIELKPLTPYITNINVTVPPWNGFMREGWIGPGSVMRRLLVVPVQLQNRGPAMEFGTLAQTPSRFKFLGATPIIDDFFELSLSDMKGRVLIERFAECQFYWKSPYSAIRPGIGAGKNLGPMDPACGAFLDVTMILDGPYNLVVRANPLGRGGWSGRFAEAGGFLPLKIEGLSVLIRKDQPARKPRVAPPDWVISKFRARPKVLPPMP